MSAQDRRIQLLNAKLRQVEHCLAYAISKLGGQLHIGNEEMIALLGNFSITATHGEDGKQDGVTLMFTPSDKAQSLTVAEKIP